MLGRQGGLWRAVGVAAAVALAVVLAAAGRLDALQATSAQAGLPAPSSSAGWAPGPAIEAQVAAAIAERWGIDADRVRLEWSPPRGAVRVPENARVELVGGGARGVWLVALVGAEPGDPGIRLWVRAGIERTEAVAARPLPRDVALSEQDLEYRTTVAWGDPAADAAAGVEPGWVTRRAIGNGEVLRPPAVAPPPAVRAGETVRVVVRRGAVELTLPARALGSAAKGERVAVRTEAGRRLEGTAAGPGTVRLDG